MAEKENKDKNYYIEGIGRRKSSTARVRIYPNQDDSKSEFLVNGDPLEEYFPIERNAVKAKAPFEEIGERHRVTVQAKGGGKTGQAESVQLGLARAIVELDEDWKPKLKKKDYLTRDAREKEREKPGLRGPRRPQQWRKR
ncbi:MAG: 30S ribosomal protein S9 [Candidatus Magasanikbacteria bacterium]